MKWVLARGGPAFSDLRLLEAMSWPIALQSQVHRHVHGHCFGRWAGLDLGPAVGLELLGAEARNHGQKCYTFRFRFRPKLTANSFAKLTANSFAQLTS